MIRLNGGSQEFYLPFTTHLSTSGMNHTCLYFLAAELPHCGWYSFPIMLKVGG